MASQAYRRMDKEIQDYTCLITRRELIRGKLQGPELMTAKIRHQQVRDGRVVAPFSVYVKFLSPARVKDREVVYVQGRHDGKLIVRNGGTRFAFITTSLPPDSPTAMQENRYPISEVGVKNLTRRLLEVGRAKLAEPDVLVQTVPGARINQRPCQLIQVSHAARREDQTFQVVRIFVDEQWKLPVYYAAYDWPDRPGEKSQLLEEYAYSEIKLNVGLSDWDFDHRNEQYRFLKSYQP
jgi:hypothetical protein